MNVIQHAVQRLQVQMGNVMMQVMHAWLMQVIHAWLMHAWLMRQMWPQLQAHHLRGKELFLKMNLQWANRRKKKAKKLSKKDLAQKVKSLQEELLGKGLEHNGSWQKAHAQIKALPARGHWQKFFETLVAGEEASFECEACKRLAAVYMPGEPEEQLEEEQEKKDAGFRKRGRPTRDARQTDVLRKYLAAHRSGIYQPVKPDHGAEGDEEAQDAKRFHYFCVPCQKVVQFFRDAVTYVHLHESQSAGHAKGLKALGLMKDGTAAGERTACNGVRVNQVSGRLSELTCSLRLWLSAGQPCALGVGAKKALLEVGSWRQQDDAFIVRHNDCCGAQSSLGCHDCLTFAENPKVAQEIASWGYKLDLITLAYNIAYGSSEDVKNHVLLMKTRGYMVTQLAGSDLDDILKLAPRGQVLHIRRSLECLSAARRNPALEDLLTTRVAGLGDHIAAGSLQADVFGAMIRKYHDAMLSGEMLQEDVKLAAMVASGGLRAKGGAVLDALFKSAMMMLERGCEKRPCSSKFFDSELGAELMFLLGRDKCMKQVLRMFGVAESVIPKVDLMNPVLPQPFVASRSRETLEQSCRAALSALNVLGKRGFQVILDETTWAPVWEVIVSLRPGHRLGYIGGHHSADPDQDFSFVPAGNGSLPEDRLSKLCVHFAVTRVDSNCHVYGVDLLPRAPKAVASDPTNGAKRTIEEYGFLFDVITRANGVPPVSGSWDGGGSNLHVNGCMLGLLSSDTMASIPFFKHCSKKPIDTIPCWIYKGILYENEHWVGGNNDSNHVFKRFTHHLCCGVRVVEWGSLVVNLSCLVRGGLSIRALAVEDIQSDADMARRLNCGYLSEDWSCFGTMVAQFAASLLISAWTSSDQFGFEEATSNALMAYYMVLLQTQQSMAKYGKEWEKHFLPSQNVRALLDLAGHAVLAAHFWPHGTPWRPRCRQEAPIERHFGQVKSFSRGTPSLKDGVYGLQMIHSKQLRDSAMWDEHESPTVTALTAERIWQKEHCMMPASFTPGSPRTGKPLMDCRASWWTGGTRMARILSATASARWNKMRTQMCSLRTMFWRRRRLKVKKKSRARVGRTWLSKSLLSGILMRSWRSWKRVTTWSSNCRTCRRSLPIQKPVHLRGMGTCQNRTAEPSVRDLQNQHHLCMPRSKREALHRFVRQLRPVPARPRSTLMRSTPSLEPKHPA